MYRLREADDFTVSANALDAGPYLALGIKAKRRFSERAWDARRLPDRGTATSPPYLHDGRCLTLEDTVEFFNLVLALKLSKEEKQDLVAFLRQL